MATLSILDDERFLVVAPTRETGLLKLVPGARYKERWGGWTVPKTWVHAKQLRAVLGPRLELDDEARAWGFEKAKHAEILRYGHDLAMGPEWPAAAIWREAWPEMPEGLLPFQAPAAAFMGASGGAILADDMGGGKTIVGLTLLHLKAEEGMPALVVCPKSVKYQWLHEAERWLPEARVVVLDGTPAKRRKLLEAAEFDVLIVNPEQLSTHSRCASYGSEPLKRCSACDPRSDLSARSCEYHERELNAIYWATVIADEAHMFLDPHSKRTRALWWLGDRAAYRYAFTGTPLKDTPDQFWALLRFVAPREWPAKTKYRERYCLSQWNGWADEVVGLNPVTAAEFYELVDLRFLRRPKELILPHLPERQYVTRVAPLAKGSKQGRAYRAMAKGLVANVEGGQVIAGSPLVQSTRLSQFASAYAVMTDEDGKIELSEPSNKLDELDAILADLNESHVIVFTESSQLLELAAKRFDKKNRAYSTVVGGQGASEREDEIESWRKGGGVLLATLGAGGTGLNLTEARVTIFLQRSWDPTLNDQAEGRTHRIGQKRPCLYITVVSENTLEMDRLDSSLRDKKERIEEITRDRAALERAIKETL